MPTFQIHRFSSYVQFFLCRVFLYVGFSFLFCELIKDPDVEKFEFHVNLVNITYVSFPFSEFPHGTRIIRYRVHSAIVTREGVFWTVHLWWTVSTFTEYADNQKIISLEN